MLRYLAQAGSVSPLIATPCIESAFNAGFASLHLLIANQKMSSTRRRQQKIWLLVFVCCGH
jgi:hypothetical protein